VQHVFINAPRGIDHPTQAELIERFLAGFLATVLRQRFVLQQAQSCVAFK
jgi:hypothetical protein